MTQFVLKIYTLEEAERLSTDALLVEFGLQSSILRAIAEEGYQLPKSLESSRKACQRALDHKLQADLERELENIDSRLEAMSTVQERRTVMGARREEILAKLGRKSKAASAGSDQSTQ